MPYLLPEKKPEISQYIEEHQRPGRMYNTFDDKEPTDHVSNTEQPSQNNRLLPGKDPHAMKKSPSIANFRSKRTTVNVQWKNISLTTNKGNFILKNLTGAVYSGELTAIMGPSGAGKTSLLNVLSGFTRHKVTGQILVNGVNRDLSVFRKLSSYILQDDHILPKLTVRETVTIAALLKIPSTVSEREREKAVDDCLKCLGLVNQQHQKADELSGGQRKRLCIAQELVSDPPLVFLDEPTSGLDSSSCLQCIELLHAMAKEGRTVVCTVHQPSSKIFDLFDKLYMIAEGYCIYRGSTRNLIPFLSSQGLQCPQYHNPADYVTEVAVGDYGDWNWKLKNAIDTADSMSDDLSRVDIHRPDSVPDMNIHSSTKSLLSEKSVDNLSRKRDKLNVSDGYATSWFTQFKVLFYRNVLCTVREPTNMQLKFFGSSVTCLLLGLLYYKIGDDASRVFNNIVVLFCTLIFMVVYAKLPTVLTFPLKRPIFEREIMNSWYSTGVYYLATTAAEFPFQLLYPIFGSSIVYWMTGQPSDLYRYALFLCTIILVVLVSESMGHLIGISSDIQNGVFLSAVIATHTILFCGFFIAAEDMPAYMRWIPYSSYGRYAFRSLMISTYSFDRPPLSCSKAECPSADPTSILKEMDIEGDLYVEYLILAAYVFAARILTFLVLKLRLMHMR